MPQELLGECEGYLCIKQAWPSTIRTIYGDQERFEMTYFAPFKVRPETKALEVPLAGSGSFRP